MKKFLIVGLGNPGPKYEKTRHNVGFRIIENLAEEHETIFESNKLADVCNIKVKGRMFFLIKPMTYMNLSGKAVNYWMEKEKIDVKNVLIITDDINLDFGTIRIKGKGSHGGHNGLKNIQEILNTSNYPRFRFGVGSEFSKGRQIDYVLGEWETEDKKLLDERIRTSNKAIISFGLAGINNTMNDFNGK
jgi:PTH1 family peptidyl-tRNA hydrolase